MYQHPTEHANATLGQFLQRVAWPSRLRGLLAGGSLLLLGGALGFLATAFNPWYLLFGVVGLLTLAVVVLRPAWGVHILLASVFLAGVLPVGGTVTDISVADGVVVALALATLMAFAAPRFQVGLPPALLLMGLYIVVGLLSAANSDAVDVAAPRLLRLAAYGVAAFSVFQLFSKTVPWRSLLIFLILGAGLIAVDVLYTQVVILSLVKDISTLNTNSVAFLFDLVIPVIVAYFLGRGRWLPGGWLWSVGLLLAADLATLSRGGYLGLACGLAVVFSLSSLRRGVKMIPIALALGALVLFLVPSSIFDRVGDDRTFTHYRAYQWSAASDVFTNHPLLGIGFNNLAGVPVYTPFGTIYSPDPHNLVLRVAGETGVVGLLVVGAIILATAWRMLRNYRALRDSDVPLALLNLGMLGGIVAYLVHALFDVFWVHNSGLLFWIYIGLTYATSSVIAHRTAATEIESPLLPAEQRHPIGFSAEVEW
jgi:O-antigen ligase